MADFLRQQITVGVVLVNWNGGEFTLPCIESLLNGTFVPDKIVVVDNASVDGSPEQISVAYPEVLLIRNAKNEGFTGANNQGIGFLLAQGVDYIWILNNDTLVARDCLATLSEIARQYPNVVGISGKIFYASLPECPWYAGAIRHRLHRAPKHLSVPTLDVQAANGAVEVEFISGCCMLIPAWAFKQFGGFVGSYIAYSEDSEWCWRVTRARQRLLYVPGAHIWHKLSASLKKNSGTVNHLGITPYASYLMVRNHLWTVRKYALEEGVFGRLSLFLNLLIQVKNFFLFGVRGELTLIKASINGVRDGLFAQVPDDVPHWE